MPYKVLVVDDDAILRKFISINLTARGYIVQEASNGKEAIEMVDVQPPDLIILDIGLPKMDGFEVCKLIRETHTTPVIMLSAKQEVADKTRCFDLGADAYMIKPFSLREFLARIEAILRRSCQQKLASGAKAQSERVTY